MPPTIPTTCCSRSTGGPGRSRWSARRRTGTGRQLLRRCATSSARASGSSRSTRARSTRRSWAKQVYPDLASVPVAVDVVDVFRRPDEAPAIARTRRRIGAKVLWLQLGITQHEARRDRGSRRADIHPGPLHEDRVRPALGRAVLERDQQRHHLEPAPDGSSGERAVDATAWTGRPERREARLPIDERTASRPARSTPAPRPIR